MGSRTTGYWEDGRSETIILTLTKCSILETWIRSAGMKDHSCCQSVVLITGSKTSQVVQIEIRTLVLRVNMRDLTEPSVVPHLRFVNPSAQQLPSDLFPGRLWSRKFSKQTPLYDSLTLLLLEGHPKSQGYQSIKRLYHQHQLLENYTCWLQLTDTVIGPSNRHII